MMSFIGKGYRTRLLNPRDEVWDRKLGVRTFGYRPARGKADDPDWQVDYVPASYAVIFEGLRLAEISCADTFTDLGSGMGRAVFAASWLGAKRSVGVEILPDLAAIAETNRRKSYLAARDIAFVCDNASAYDLASTTLLYMFHPFGPATVESVIEKLQINHDPGLRIVYVNPVHSDLLRKRRWLVLAGSRKKKRRVGTSGAWEIELWKVTAPPASLPKRPSED